MNAFRQYLLLLKVLSKNALAHSSVALSGSKSKKSSAAGSVVTFVIVFIAVAAMSASNAVSMSIAAHNYGGEAINALFYMFFASAQFVILFFGAITVISNLYFAKDTALLSTLPTSSGTVFAAKFTLAYFSELIFSFLILFPMLIVSGITLSSMGLEIKWSFYLISVVSVFLAPAAPLLAVTLVSMPLMNIVSRLRKKTVGSGIALTTLYVVILGIYFVFIGLTAGMSAEGAMSEGTFNSLAMLKKATIFNYPIVSALLGIKSAFNVLYYALGVMSAMGISVGLSLIFYRKGVTALLESGAQKRSKRTKEEKDFIRPVSKSLLIKEFRTLINTPVLLMNSALGLIMPAIVMAFLRFAFPSGEGGELYITGTVTYICYLMISSANTAASVGFSAEGKNLFLLKTMPVGINEILRVKLTFACLITLINTSISAIAFPLVTGIRSAVAITGLPAVMLLGGFGSNCMLLASDLRNPNLRWTNLNEIVKNNKRTLKPMLVSIVVGFFYMIFGSILGAFSDLKAEIMFIIFYGVGIIPPIIIAIIGYGRLKRDPEKYYDAIS